MSLDLGQRTSWRDTIRVAPDGFSSVKGGCGLDSDSPGPGGRSLPAVKPLSFFSQPEGKMEWDDIRRGAEL